MFLSFSPLMLLLWISALCMIVGIIFSATFSACMTMYYNAKDAHWKKWITAFGKSLAEVEKKMEKKAAEDKDKITEDMSKKLDEIIRKWGSMKKGEYRE